MNVAPSPGVRGFLIHLTHYDPRWYKRKGREKPFDSGVALEVVERLAAEGFNLLVIDIADAVHYRSHPELRRRYTVPMKRLVELAGAARKAGLEVVPKLNFARSAIHTHNHWMRSAETGRDVGFDDEPYWRMAFELIDEAVAACRPERFFHVGMDEDHDRSYTQYVEAIGTLHAGLKERGLRTIIWNDSASAYPAARIHRDKSLLAARKIPRDVVQVLWNYRAVPRTEVRRLGRQGFELWGAPGRTDPEQMRGFRDAVLKAGGTGLLMTMWIPTRKGNRRALLDAISRMGPIYRGEE